MQNYINQLLADISRATTNVSLPFVEKELDLVDWISDEEEDKTAFTRNLEEWTGIRQDMLPPEEMLSDEHIDHLLCALKKMLDAYNWSFVLQTQVPKRIQYHALRSNFSQEAKIKRWHMGFFELCHAGTVHRKCALGGYCECAFFADFFSGFEEDDRSPEEQRASELGIEIKYLKNKWGEDWMKYYPYHLDVNYDDKNGNPYNFGFYDTDPGDNW